MASVGQEPSGGDRWQCDLKGHGQEIGGGHIIWVARQEVGGLRLGILNEAFIGGKYAVNGERGEDDFLGVLAEVLGRGRPASWGMRPRWRGISSAAELIAVTRPITGQGRFIAGGLMVAGIALLGFVTPSLASWLIDKVREVEEHTQAATRADVAALAAEVHALRHDLELRD